MTKYVTCMTIVFAWLVASSQVEAQGTLVLENGRLGLSFERTTGTLASIRNKLTGETYEVSGDRFAVEAVEFRLDFADAKLISLNQQGETLKAQYHGGGLTSAHIAGDRGLIFLFNSGKTSLSGEFALTKDAVGLNGSGDFRIAQEHPPSDRSIKSALGETVRWEVPAETAVVLRIQRAEVK